MNRPVFPHEINPSQDVTPMKRSRPATFPLVIGAAVVLAAAGAGWVYFGRSAPAAAAMPAPTVQATYPITRQVTQWDDYVGRFAPIRSVEVRPRVSGAITAIHFRDGDHVRSGQPLFTIDPRPYRAALAEAQADVASASSALQLARADYARVAGLTGDEAIADAEVDARRARVRSASAALASAQARVRSRALDVEFATVRAPISGRISDRRIDAGNLVSGEGGANATLLTTINALDPIYFDFDASEALFLKAQRDRKEGRAPAAVQVRLQDETGYAHEGTLDFTDNGLDPRSGTIRVRARFANPDGFLTPGMFGNMRLATGGTVKALLVPDAAVHADQARRIVLTVGKDGTVAAKPVEVGPLVDGLRVIRSGLSAQDMVVLSNFQMAAPGTKVQVRRGTIKPSATPKPATDSIPMAAQATLAN
ncbi:RND family efflux transporter MFP subunit [Sphingobium sp. OAS761]|uniref:efflux RND transporter periplasmic adaptor subunit n=1 Tax=Sphingobium sp. OAS761 TaxID=2817901 RepID=UPI00209F33AF|nr:efflux RND transporter periplasmic adaptor subunit [Sphingobium sp. OAS761]MCP1469523.1 RND family efflux transporter MFP subunit [Sphingobium sp. OAS761]